MTSTNIRRPTIIFIALVLALVLTGKLLFSFHFSLFFFYGLSVTTLLLITFVVTHFFYHDPYQQALLKKSVKKKITATCIVAVRNEENIIDRCILSLINQTHPQLEVILVDDCSTDGTAKIIHQYEQGAKIKAIYLSENVGKKRAIAQAVKIAKGKIFVFSDSDSILEATAVEKIVRIFQAFPDVGGISGHCRALNATQNFFTKVQDSWYDGQFSIRKAYESIFGAVTCVSGPLAAFRREAVYNFMPAWENDSFLGQEFKFATDRTLTGYALGAKWVGQKLKNKYEGSPFAQPNYPVKEWQIVYSKSTKAWTNVPDSFPKMIKQQIRWKKSFIRNMFFTGQFFWRKPLPVSLAYYLHILFVLVGPFIALKHIVLLPLQQNYLASVLYVLGIVLVGFLFGIIYKIENPTCHRWVYRPFMSLMSTLIFSWLIFYSITTIRKMTWVRG